LIQKIYEVDPLTCPKCSGKMKIISVIEEEDVIKKYSKTLGCWKQRQGCQQKPTPISYTSPFQDSGGRFIKEDKNQ